jgi:NAD(P)-dependent dehydrogenase (short-subunit alcohol dehydrogenase family)
VVETLTRARPAESGASGVRVNAISPPVIRTPDHDRSVQHRAEVRMAGRRPGRRGRYPASDEAEREAEFVPGTVIDGGGAGGLRMTILDCTFSND